MRPPAAEEAGRDRAGERTGRVGEPPVTSFLAEQLATAHWFDQRLTRTALAWTPEVSLDEGFARLEAHLRGVVPTIEGSQGL